MQAPQASAAQADFQYLPLAVLELAPENVRTTPAGLLADAELKASIAAHGIIENLVVYPAAEGRFAVSAGGRRFEQTKALAADGVLGPDHPMPCRIQPDACAAHELSLAENVVRAAMHPADQVVAFRTLADEGESAAAIAARFGVSEHTVAQRLRLGHAAPELLDAYRADEMDLATLMAFTVTTDPARQRAVWDELKVQGYRPSARQVKRLLTEGRVPAEAAIARYVGVDAYEAAGGAVTRDLFADDDESGVWLDDPGTLRTLAMQRLEAAAEELRTRWAWAEVHLEVDWATTARYWRVQPEPCEATDAETAEIETLAERLAELDDDEWTEALAEEAEAAQERIEAIHVAIERRAVYRREDRAIAGCIVTIGEDGTLAVVQGLVRPEDRPEANAADGAAGSDSATAAETPDGAAPPNAPAPPRLDPPALARPTLPPDPEAVARKEVGIGIGLADDLRCLRTAIVKSELACDFEAAFDLLLFQLARAVFERGYHDDALDIAVRVTADRPSVRSDDAEFAAANIGEKFLIADLVVQPLDWLKLPAAEAFAALRALPERKKRRLFATCVARTLKGQLAFEPSARPEVEATVARLDVDFAKVAAASSKPLWSAALVWMRITRARILDVARATLGDAWAAARSKLKKAEIAEAMEAAFDPRAEAPGDVTPEGRAAALAWTPPGFRAFDTGRPAEEEAPAGDDASKAGPEAAAEPDPAPDAGDEEAAAPSGEAPANGAHAESGAAPAEPQHAGSNGCDPDATPANGTASGGGNGAGDSDGHDAGEAPADPGPVNGVEALRIGLEAAGWEGAPSEPEGADPLPAFLRGV